MLTEEERRLKEAEAAKRQEAAAKELEEMDSMFNQPDMPDPIGDMKESAKPGMEEVEEVEEVENAPVEMAPEELQPEPKVEATKSGEEAKVEDEYDFDFLNNLARQAVGKSKVESQPTQVAETVTPAIPTPVHQPTFPAQVPLPTDFLTKEEVEKAIQAEDQAGAFLGLFQQVYQRAHVAAAELALTQLPTVSQPMLMQMARNVALVDNFYKENSDLDKARDFVQYCAMQVEAKHPDYGYEKVLAEAAKLARTRMPLLQKARAAEARQPAQKAAFATQSGSKSKKVGQTELSALEKELAEMPNHPY